MRTLRRLLPALVLAGCATSRSPLELRVERGDLTVAPGDELRVSASLVNRGKTAVRIHRDSEPEFMVSCRRAIDPAGEFGVGYGSGARGIVWGGVTDRRPDPDDPKYCREYPPESIDVPASGTLPYSLAVRIPSRCAEGEGELEISFHALDDGRRCPGMWFGDLHTAARRLRIRHPVAGARGAPSASPAALACRLAPAAGGDPALEVVLGNPTDSDWTGLAIPSLEMTPEGEEAYVSYWAPLRLSGAGGPLAAGETDRVEIPARGELRRALRLADLRWGEDSGPWPAGPLSAVPAGRYEVALWMELLGGKSWELRCAPAAVELGGT